MLTFPNRILFVGFGAVARCTLPILLQHISVDPKHITIIDFEPNEAALKPWIEQGITFVRDRVTPENLGTLLGQHVSAGDLLIDLSWNIDCCEIVQWCHDRGVLYINTSVELWDPYGGADDKHPPERTLYWRHMNLRRMVARWSEPGPTAVLEHGANPGLISHFTKQALLDIARQALADQKFSGAQAEKIAYHAKAQELNHLAHQLGVKVIHCSERDTQITDQPKQVNPTFKGVWSTVVNFALWPPPDTKPGQYPQHHKRSDDSLGRHALGGWAYRPLRNARASLAQRGQTLGLRSG